MPYQVHDYNDDDTKVMACRRIFPLPFSLALKKKSQIIQITA
jgi:hypothetical protein